MSGEFTDDLDDLARQLDALEVEADGLDLAHEMETTPAAAPGRPELAPQGMDAEDALPDAAFMVEMAEQTVTAIWPELEYDDKARQRVASKLAPVLAKRNGELPPWLAAYREEMAFVWTLAVVIAQSVRMIKNARPEDAGDDEKPEPATA